MKPDRTLVKEIKALTNGGSREAKFALLNRLAAAAADLSTPEARANFGTCLSKYGRALVAICVAATLEARRERLDFWGYDWACEVLDAVPVTLTPSNRERAYIDDNLHPTAICDYAGELIRLTTAR